jgi:multiple sugar transport system ATP-binding protein
MRPQHIAQGEGQQAELKRIEHLGDHTRLHLNLLAHAITTIADPDTTYTPGLQLKIAPKNPLCFDADGNRIR